MEYWREIFVLVASPTATVAILAYALRKWFDMLLARDNERLKSELELVRIERASQLSAIAERRATVISEFYALLARMSRELTRVTSLLQTGDRDAQSARWDAAANLANQTQDFFHEHRLFFDKESCEMVDEVFEIMRSAHVDFSVSQMPDVKDRTSKWVEADKQMREKVPPLLYELAERFRQILGA